MLSLSISRQKISNKLHPVSNIGVFSCVLTEILERMGTVMTARRQELKELEQNRAESRRLALIARMQRLFSLTGQDA